MPLQLDAELCQALQSMAQGQAPLAPLVRGDVEGRRSRINPGILALAGPELPQEVSMTDCFTESEDGAKVPLRWYHKDHQQGSPAVVYVHGGGMILGSIEVYNTVVSRYTAKTNTPFLSIEYRLAPENPHPTPVNDVYAGIVWLFAHAEELRINRDEIAIMGDSAGGGLAAAAALLTRERGGPRLAKMILLSPMLDDRTITAPANMAPLLSWNTTDNETGWDALLGEKRGRESVSEIASPGRMVSANGLPPLYLEVGELDLFRDESLSFAAKFWASGISVELHVYPGCNHGFDLFSAESTAVAKRAFEARYRAIASIEPLVGKANGVK